MDLDCNILYLYCFIVRHAHWHSRAIWKNTMDIVTVPALEDLKTWDLTLTGRQNRLWLVFDWLETWLGLFQFTRDLIWICFSTLETWLELALNNLKNWDFTLTGLKTRFILVFHWLETWFWLADNNFWHFWEALRLDSQLSWSTQDLTRTCCERQLWIKLPLYYIFKCIHL